MRHLATPALPRIPLPQPDYRNGAKSGLTAHRRRVLTVAHRGQQDRPTEILIRPSNACAGAKRLLAQLTPLQLRVNGRRGWPMVLRGATAEGKVKSIGSVPSSLQTGPGFGGAWRNLSRGKLKSNIVTHPDIAHTHHDQESTTIGLSTPALPRVPLPQPGYRNGAKSGLTAHRRRVLTVARRAAGPATLRF